MTADPRAQLEAALAASGMTRAQFARSLVIRTPPKRGISPRHLRNLLDGTCAVGPDVLRAATVVAAAAVTSRTIATLMAQKPT